MMKIARLKSSKLNYPKKEYKNELQGYKTTNATMRFPLNEKLPLDLIKKLVEARLNKNDEAK
jgi:uncharacterized protein YdhG (YjbR/CyaY superfamily)